MASLPGSDARGSRASTTPDVNGRVSKADLFPIIREQECEPNGPVAGARQLAVWSRGGVQTMALSLLAVLVFSTLLLLRIAVGT